MGVLFVFLAVLKGAFLKWYLIIGLPITFILLIAFYFMNKGLEKSEIPGRTSFILLNILALFTGLIWSYIVISILIDILTCIGIIAKISAVFLGLTIIAIGNALPDGLVTIALAKEGYA